MPCRRAARDNAYDMPGLRIGWAVTRHAALREQMLLGKFNNMLCSPVLEEALAVNVLERQDAIVGARRRHLAEGLARTEAWVTAESAFLEWVRQDAGALCCIRLRAECFDAAAEVRRSVAACKMHGVRLGEGRWFGEEERVFRLGFGLLHLPRPSQPVWKPSPRHCGTVCALPLSRVV